MPVLTAAIAVAVVAAGAAATAAVAYRPGQGPATIASQANAPAGPIANSQVGAQAAGMTLNAMPRAVLAAQADHDTWAKNPLGLAAGRKHHRPKSKAIVPPVYLNPLRDVTGLIPQRIDMGADFAGSGPIYALGDAVITGATGVSSGWPGGGWITYQLTSGPAAGLVVYVAEDVRPAVQVGQKVTSSTVIAAMFAGGAGIETGWAMPDGASAESQLPEAGGISGQGPFPTRVGVNFDELLTALGVTIAPNAGQAAFGLLPSNYPASWLGLTGAK